VSTRTRRCRKSRVASPVVACPCAEREDGGHSSPAWPGRDTSLHNPGSWLNSLSNQLGVALNRHTIFRMSVQPDVAAIAALDRAGAIFARRDEIKLQLDDLARIRTPERGRFADRSDVVAGIVGDTPLDHFGAWVYYPWSGHLVHILDEPEFIESVLRPTATRSPRRNRSGSRARLLAYSGCRWATRSR
jgi:hypothetical protein